MDNGRWGPEEPSSTKDERIAWVLGHPRMSPWLKEALGSAAERNPIDVLNDLEMLNLLLRVHAAEQMQAAAGNREVPTVIETVTDTRQATGRHQNMGR